jgi:hypothetical protein
VEKRTKILDKSKESYVIQQIKKEPHMKEKTEYDQQGDVLLFKESELPKDLTRIKGKTVAYGEMTGHNHTFYDSETCVAEKFDHTTGAGSKNVNLYEDSNKTIFAEIIAPVWLKHQEHKPIEFKPGVYRIGIVREYDHVEKLTRKVVD